MIKRRIWISWLFAGIFLVSAIFLRDKMEWWIRWGSFGLFMALPLGIERTNAPPFLERLLNTFWVCLCWAAALQWAFSSALSRHGINLVVLSVAAYVLIWVYRDVVFLRSGGANEDRTVGAKSVPPLASFLPVLKSIAEEFKVPSLGLAVTNGAARHDWIAVTGRRSVNAEDPVTISDKFHLGSCGKSMTATLAGVLVDQGLLEWKLTLGEFFSGIPIHPLYAPVTLEQLLCHRGGVPSDLKADGLWAKVWQHPGTPSEQRAFLVEQVLSKAPACFPGRKYLYANAGYAIAGAIIEQLLKEPWEACIQARLFQPLGMTSVGFGAPATPGKIDQPWGHRPGLGNLPQPFAPGPTADNPAAIAPAGTIHCTLLDWTRYAAFHLAGRSPNGTLQLSPATFHKLHTPDCDRNYAYGWIVTRRPWTHGPALTHAGSNTMFYAVIWLAPERDYAVMAVTNLGGDQASQACDRVVSSIIHG